MGLIQFFLRHRNNSFLSFFFFFKRKKILSNLYSRCLSSNNKLLQWFQPFVVWEGEDIKCQKLFPRVPPQPSLHSLISVSCVSLLASQITARHNLKKNCFLSGIQFFFFLMVMMGMFMK